jgi:hypothetical protein
LYTMKFKAFFCFLRKERYSTRSHAVHLAYL